MAPNPDNLPNSKPHPLNWFRMAIAVLLVCVATASLTIYVTVLIFSGDKTSTTETDWEWKRRALVARPIIEALHQHKAKNGAYPADDSPQIPSILKSSAIPGNPEGINDWAYHQTSNPPGFTLTNKLGWNASFEYRFNGSTGAWVYNPGDGKPEKNIKLDP